MTTPHDIPHFPRVAIIGVGLLGSSFGLALRAQDLATEVIGIGRRKSSLATALERGAIDRSTEDVLEGVQDAQLILIATPAATVTGLLDALRNTIAPDAIVTDVASTKASICAHAAATWAAPRRFIGSHPMAGSEQFGPEHGNANLYRNSICLVERSPDMDESARATLVALWNAIGARVVDIDPETHDSILARTSHLPHILAAVTAQTASRQGDIAAFVGKGFRDVTRVAAGRAEVWRDICLTNREAILEGLSEIEAHLGEYRDALEAGDGAKLEALFEAGRNARQKAVDS